MKKLLAAFLGGVILIAGINCTKDSPYRIKKSQNVFFRGEGINVNGEAQSYSRIINYVVNPKKRNQKRIYGGGVGDIELWGNRPDGQIIVKMKNDQSCANNITVSIGQDNGTTIKRTKFFEGYASDTFNIAMDSSRTAFVYIYTDTNCGDFFDPDALGPGSNTFSFDIEELPMHFKTFDVEQRSMLLYRTTFTITNLDGADHINIQASLDGLTWRTIKVIQANDIQLGKPYSVEVNVK